MILCNAIGSVPVFVMPLAVYWCTDGFFTVANFISCSYLFIYFGLCQLMCLKICWNPLFRYRISGVLIYYSDLSLDSAVMSHLLKIMTVAKPYGQS